MFYLVLRGNQPRSYGLKQIILSGSDLLNQHYASNFYFFISVNVKDPSRTLVLYTTGAALTKHNILTGRKDQWPGLWRRNNV